MKYDKKLGEVRAYMYVAVAAIILLAFLWKYLAHHP
jgi:hypothetical protein